MIRNDEIQLCDNILLNFLATDVFFTFQYYNFLYIYKLSENKINILISVEKFMKLNSYLNWMMYF